MEETDLPQSQGDAPAGSTSSRMTFGSRRIAGGASTLPGLQDPSTFKVNPRTAPGDPGLLQPVTQVEPTEAAPEYASQQTYDQSVVGRPDEPAEEVVPGHEADDFPGNVLPPVMGPTSVPRTYPFGGGSPTPPFADETWQPTPRTPFCLGPSVPSPTPLEPVPSPWPFADPAAFIPVEGPLPPGSQAPAVQQIWLPIGQPIQVLPHHSAQQAMPEMNTWSTQPQFTPMSMELGTGSFGVPGQVPGHGPVVSAGGLWFPPQQPAAIPLFPDGKGYGIIQPGPRSATMFVVSGGSYEGSTVSGSGDTVSPRGSGLRPTSITVGDSGEFGQFIPATARPTAAVDPVVPSPDPRSDQPCSDDDFLWFVRERLSGMTGPRRAAVLREIRALVNDMETQEWRR